MSQPPPAAPQTGPALSVDDHSESDSAYGDSLLGSETTSLASSVLDYKYENGRRYHAFQEGAYVLPNDEQEQDRLDMLHHIYRLILGGALYKAPITTNTATPQRVLDLGCGTGIWCMELADELPETVVQGVDLSPIQPVFVPPNCQFYVDDLEAPWTYEEKFDYIHGRAMAAVIADWPALFRQIFDNLNPGGYVEFQEYHCEVYSDDDTLQRATNLTDWVETMSEMAEKFGKPLKIGTRLRGWMEDAGFEDIHDQVYRISIGRWAKGAKLKEIGTWYRAQFVEAIEPFSIGLFTRVLGKSLEETQAIIAGVRQDLMNTKLHLYVNFHFCYGRKPGSKPG